MSKEIILLLFCGLALLALAAATHFTGNGSLDNIKSKTVGDGQHGTARWATRKEIEKTYRHIPFRPSLWRRGEELPKAQGLVLGCVGKKDKVTALVDPDDIHCLMIGASGVGKTAFFLYPNLEYACASGMSFLALDTKGDLARNYGAVATKYYGYQAAVIDLRNPTRSDGYNLLTLINHYMDVCREEPKNIAARAKAEKYAKILSKTIVNPEGDASNYGQNAFFYDAAEGLLTAVILLLAEYLPPTKEHPEERRHIVSVFKLVQDLLAPVMVGKKPKNGFQVLMGNLPDTHKAKWFAGAALNSADQAMMSVMSTVLSRLNAFLDSELEQVLCFDSAIDAESFASRKSAIFLILPEEDPSKNFIRYILTNEKYTGNSTWQKYYTTDMLPYKHPRNRGQKESYYAENTHEAIVSMEDFTAVQDLLARRRELLTPEQNIPYSFRRKIFCGNCGTVFRRKTVRGIVYWACMGHDRKGNAFCPVTQVPEYELQDAFLRLYHKLKHHGDHILKQLLSNLQAIRDHRMLWSSDVVALNKQISDINDQERMLAAMHQAGLVDPDIFISQSNDLARRLQAAKREKERLIGERDSDTLSRTADLLEELEAMPDFLPEFDGEVFGALVEKLTVEPGGTVRFHLKNGLQLTETVKRRPR